MGMLCNVTCPTCGIDYWVPQHEYMRRGLTGQLLHCYSGHGHPVSREEAEEIKAKYEAWVKREQKREAEKSKTKPSLWTLLTARMGVKGGNHD